MRKLMSEELLKVYGGGKHGCGDNKGDDHKGDGKGEDDRGDHKGDGKGDDDRGDHKGDGKDCGRGDGRR